MIDTNKYILVTGGAGYIGSHTVVALSEKGYRVIIVDDFRNSDQTVLQKFSELCPVTPIHFELDCSRKNVMKIIFDHYPIAGAIHFAAYKSVGESIEKPGEYFHNNMQSLQVLTELMNDHGVDNLVFSSSCTVYGEPDQIEVTESEQHKPATSPYGYTKQMGENYLAFLSKSSRNNIRSTILRYFNPIGAHPSGQIGELPNGIPNNLVPYICQSASGIRGALTIFGDDYDTPDGTCIRDFIHVVDLAEAHISALEKQFASREPLSVYNVGTGKGTSVMELINLFQEVTGKTLLYKVGPRRTGDIVQIYANTHKINQELGWKARYSVAEALSHSWNWQIKSMTRNQLVKKVNPL